MLLHTSLPHFFMTFMCTRLEVHTTYTHCVYILWKNVSINIWLSTRKRQYCNFSNIIPFGTLYHPTVCHHFCALFYWTIDQYNNTSSMPRYDIKDCNTCTNEMTWGDVYETKTNICRCLVTVIVEEDVINTSVRSPGAFIWHNNNTLSLWKYLYCVIRTPH